MSSYRGKSDLLIGSFLGFGLAGCLFYLHNRIVRQSASEDLQDSTPKPKVPYPESSSEIQVDLHLQQSQIGTPHYGLQDPQFDGCIYFDYNATTPIYREVYEAMMPFLTKCFGNPSSSHIFGKPCKTALLKARRYVAALINAQSAAENAEEIVFTSCGSESDNRAIDIALIYYYNNIKPNLNDLEKNSLPTVITSAVEHPAVLCYLRALQMQGKIKLEVIGVNEDGFVNLAELSSKLSRTTALVTIMHSNNEVGTIQPIRAVGHSIASFNQREKAGVLFHSDAAQSVGKVPIDVQGLGVDLLTIVGHKFGAPKGIAALFIKKGVKASPMLVGGGQEGGLRAGTENVPYAVALGEAARIAQVELHEYIMFMLTQKLRFLQQMENLLGKSLMENVQYNGPPRLNSTKFLAEDLKMLKIMLRPQSKMGQSSRGTDIIEQLPNTISVSFKHIIGHELVALLGTEVACSAGSACHSAPIIGSPQETPHYVLSEVLQAMSVKEEFGLGTLRISLGRHTTADDIDKAVPIIVNAVKKAWRI